MPACTNVTPATDGNFRQSECLELKRTATQACHAEMDPHDQQLRTRPLHAGSSEREGEVLQSNGSRKRRKQMTEEEKAESAMRDKESVLERGTHPYGVEPWGNFFQKENAKSIRQTSLGVLNVLPDNALLDILGFLNASHLGRTACCSRAFYAFSHQDELWRALVLETVGGDFCFEGCWKDTMGRHVRGDSHTPHKPLQIEHMYSDLLFQPWLCTSLGICQEWCEVENIDRRSNLSLQDFIDEYEKPNRPVIITDVVSSWPAFKRWNWDTLEREFGQRKLACGPVDMTMASYRRYCAGVSEEKPLYIFDKHFASAAPQLAADYTVPSYFADDLFSLLPPHTRPDFRWVIVGPERSGSAFHIDPNATSAWNAVIKGKKKWVLYPPHCAPPGVVPSSDMSEVTSSASLGEWFLNFYPATKTGKVRPLECVCAEGDLMFVPRGWWHAVWNLEPSIAITQNFVPERNAAVVAAFLKSKPQCISGLPPSRRSDLLPAFLDALAAHRPHVLEAMRREEDARHARDVQASLWRSLVPDSSGGDGSSDGAVAAPAEGGASFSFGF